MQSFLEFEKPIAELDGKLEELRRLQGQEGAPLGLAEEITQLRSKHERALRNLYAKLTPWQKVQVARHPARPHCQSYIAGLIEDFTPLAGDRLYGEDAAITGGLGRFQGRSVMVIGQEKGHDTESRVRHNFGMAKPEGYRKAQRLFALAEQFELPILSLIDTAGAYPGVASEERGQAEAIARSIDLGLKIKVPFIAAVIGEGGSGGAIAIASADRLLMFEHAIYSVISPEGCASILWRSASKAMEAAQALRLTAQDLKELGIIDRVVEEPVGGAHRAPEEAIKLLGQAFAEQLASLSGLDAAQLVARRRQKFLEMGSRALA
jgi:acetyl-CoA carboxylase carboxyl transferase subunit alpha